MVNPKVRDKPKMRRGIKALDVTSSAGRDKCVAGLILIWRYWVKLVLGGHFGINS